jgi:hypothetical protein
MATPRGLKNGERVGFDDIAGIINQVDHFVEKIPQVLMVFPIQQCDIIQPVENAICVNKGFRIRDEERQF